MPSLLTHAPIAGTSLTGDKVRAAAGELAALSADRPLETGGEMRAFLKEQSFLRYALIKLLHPRGELAQIAALSLRMQWPDLSAEEALHSVQSIFINRRDDQAALLRLLTPASPLITQMLAARVHGTPVSARELSASKRAQLVVSLAQPHLQEGPEPAVHIVANAIGQRKMHAALAAMFAPKSPLDQSLREALHEALPEIPAPHIDRFVEVYLGQRERAARLVVDALPPEGGAVHEAIRLSESLRIRPKAAKPPEPPALPLVTLGGVSSGTIFDRLFFRTGQGAAQGL